MDEAISYIAQSKFLSTPSARRATRCRRCPAACLQDFYPRPLRGGRPGGQLEDKPPARFLSTPSARRATPFRPERDPELPISIHALCEEGDL